MKIILFAIGLIVAIFLSFISCNGKIEIISVPILTTIDTLKGTASFTVSRTDYFLVDVQTNMHSIMKREIENYIKKNNVDSVARNYDQYNMEFYKISKEINLNEIQKDPDYVENQAMVYNRPIFEYTWYSGKFGVVIEFKNGKAVPRYP